MDLLIHSTVNKCEFIVWEYWYSVLFDSGHQGITIMDGHKTIVHCALCITKEAAQVPII